MSKHTPGPWTMVRDGEEDFYVILTGEDAIATGLHEADTRLIAAAPDLLTALKLVEPYVSLDHLGEVHAAIAKAEGTS